MRKITKKTWSNIHSDYKLIKDGKRYAMIENCTLEPVEIDDQNGQYFVKIVFTVGSEPFYQESISGLYDPTKTQEENFKNMIQKVVHYNDDYKYYIDNNLYNIISVVEK